MNRKTLIAFAAFIVLGIGALFALRQPEKGERASDRPRPLQPLKEMNVLEVTKGGATTVIKHEGGKYKVTAPVAYAADEPAAKAAFEALTKMEVSSLVTEQKAKQAEFEVDDKATRVVAKRDDKVLADFFVGKASAGNGTMLRLNGQDQIYAASGLSKYVIDKSPADWRDKSVTTFTAADAERLDVVAKDGSKLSAKKTGTKEGSDDKWEVVESSVKIDKLDNSIPAGIVQSMSMWKANDFADTVKPAEAGLEPAALTITVSLKGGKKAVAQIGNKKGDDEIYVKTPDAPQVFVVKKYNVERINRRPIDFRDKTLCNLADTDLSEIAVTHGADSYTVTRTGSDWKATKPPKLEIDTAKITPIASAFKDWKATSFAEDPSPAATGLAKPKAVIAAKSKTKGDPGCTLKVGDETKDKISVYVSTAKGPDVLVAPKWSVDRILVKVDDLKKPGGVAAKK